MNIPMLLRTKRMYIFEFIFRDPRFALYFKGHSRRLFSTFYLIWPVNIFYSSVTDESIVDEWRVWRTQL